MLQQSEGNSVDFLLINNFSKLRFEEQLQVKTLGRQIPDIKNISIPGKNTNRSFNPDWFHRKEWLTASSTTGLLYCFPCILFEKSENSDHPWTRKGYCDLKNLSACLNKHECSTVHVRACLKLKLFGRVRIDECLNETRKYQTKQHNEEVTRNREIMRRLIDVTLFLGKQELSFRGNDEKESSSNRGNFKELSAFLANYDSVLREHFASSSVFRGDSKDIQNDMIESISAVIQNNISQSIIAAPFFSIEVDETTDVSTSSQLTIIARFVKANVEERFLGFIDISTDKSAAYITSSILDRLKLFSPETKLICQTYDGASTMSGHISGVQSRIRQNCPKAIFIHCFAHRLNLVLGNGAKMITSVRQFFSTLSGLHSFFLASPKRMRFLQDFSTHISSNPKRMVHPCETRWNFKGRAVEVVAEQYEILRQMFLSIVNEPEVWDDLTISSSQGFLHVLHDFQFIFILHSYRHIFAHTEVLFKILQSSSLNISRCCEAIKDTIMKISVCPLPYRVFARCPV